MGPEMRGYGGACSVALGHINPALFLLTVIYGISSCIQPAFHSPLDGVLHTLRICRSYSVHIPNPQ
jgi:hypothetical protein